MERRVLLAVFLSFLVLVLYQRFLAPPVPLDLATADPMASPAAPVGATEPAPAVRDASPAAVNSVSLVGHSTLRVDTMADLERPANDKELARMCDRFSAALDDGAIADDYSGANKHDHVTSIGRGLRH